MSNPEEQGRAIDHTAERAGGGVNGILMLLLALALLALSAYVVVQGAGPGGKGYVAGGLFLTILATVLILTGFYTVQPNQGVAITLFGRYKGTDRRTGLHWVLPWYTRKKISLRVRNVTSEMLKVNDRRGNPIEIAVNVVWRVSD